MAELYTRELDDGREISVLPMTFGKARICIGPAPAISHGYDDGWCYSSHFIAIAAAAAWDGEGDPPDGWHRHIGSGRRREEGDPAREYVSR